MNPKEKDKQGLNTTPQPCILLGGDQFLEELEKKSTCASIRFLVQVMTFEGDSAGKKLIDLMVASPARNKLLVVDCYSDVVINDTLVHLPPGLFNKKIRSEHRETQRLLQYAQDCGIKVSRTNPIGAWYHRYPLRNHKKSILIDDFLCIGGINFSDHNFAWHDMMVLLNSPHFADIAARDIISNSEGRITSGIHQSNDETLVLLNRHGEAEYTELFSWIKQAHSSITIFSPYISEPFLSVLKSVSDAIAIKIVVPEKNNKSIFSDYLKRESHNGWFQYCEVPGLMSHLKALVIDDRELIFGSSNFDFISYLFEEEIVFRTTSEPMIREFKQVVHDPVLGSARQLVKPPYHRIKSYIPTILWKLLRVTDPKSHQLYQNQ